MQTAYCAVSATITMLALEKVERALQALGVPGLTVNRVKGYGVYKNFYQRDWLVTHARIQVYVREQRVQEVVNAIMDAAHTGDEDDGVIVVTPILHFYRIADRCDLCTQAASPDTEDDHSASAW